MLAASFINSNFTNDGDFKKILSFMDELSSSDRNFRKNVLLAFERWFGFHQLNFWLCDERNQLLDPVTLNTDETITKDYLRNYIDMDKLLPQKVTHIIPKQRVIGLLDFQSKKEHEDSEFYNSFMKKNGFYHNIGMYLVKDSKIIGMIDYVSGEKEKSLNKTDRILLEILSRYLTQETDAYIQKYKTIDKLNPNKEALTPREKEVMKLVQQGYSNKEIATNLYISINTVKKHVQSLYQKFNVNNRTSLSFKASQFIS